MIAYYSVRRNQELKYIISLYYRNMMGRMKEMHRSVHSSPKQVNEVIQKYRDDGYHVQSIATA